MRYQTTFLSLECLTKQTRADRFIDEIKRVVPWAELEVHDRLSFQRFLGLDPLNQRVPVETTVLHFFRRLECHDPAERIFAKVNFCSPSKTFRLHLPTITDRFAEAP